MNIQNYFYFLLTFSLYCSPVVALREKAFCAVPIADCACQSLTILYEHQDCITTYENIPLSGKLGTHACPRDQQLLLHEEVTIVDKIGDEVQIEVPHLFYIEPDFLCYHKNSFWTLKKNLITYKELEERGINYRRYLPYPITQDTNKIFEYNSSIVALKMPFHDPVTQQTYSAGTRFMTAYQTVQQIIVWIFDATTVQFNQTAIDRSLCYTYEQKAHEQRLYDFVQLLQLWAKNSDGFIPFVWGGSNMQELCTDQKFDYDDEEQPYQTIEFWQRPECTQKPYAGFDASSLVVRAAQIVGIPYYAKNAITAHSCLQPINTNDQLNNGDIIWLPTGLIVISDITNNKVIAARGYQTGYGRVVECTLSQFFNNITTFKDLQKAYTTKQPLECCNKDGITTKLFSDWDILRLPQP